MIGYLVLGLFLAGLLILMLNWWANADVQSAKRSLFWGVVILCLLMGAILLAMGRGIMAIAPAGFAFWRMMSANRQRPANAGQANVPPHTSKGDMSYREAFEILGLKPGASEEDIRKAHKRLIALNHPDKGGSDWMAAKLNEARKLLLEK